MSIAFFLLAIVGAVAIRVIAAVKLSKQSGTFAREFVWGWTRARLFDIPALIVFWGWFYLFVVCGIVAAFAS